VHDLLDQDEPDVFLESFVDVLSCGLGAALLLFLIFSTLPRDGDGAQGGDGLPANTVVVPDAAGQNAGRAAQVIVVVSGDAPARARIVFCFRGDGQLPRCVEVRAEAPPTVASELSVSVGRLANGDVTSSSFKLRVQGDGGVAAVRTDRAQAWVNAGGRC
jgi:hypothetical protein